MFLLIRYILLSSGVHRHERSFDPQLSDNVSARGSSAARPQRNRARQALEATRREVRRVLELTAGG
jgi:hypothetical protein